MKPLLQPAAVLVLWTMGMWAWLYATRLPAMRRAGIDLSKLKGGTGRQLDGAIPDEVQWKAHNYNHLMEQPTLFYALIAMLALMGDPDQFTVQMAWAYVVLRVVHSLVQALWNKITVRWAIFMLSSSVLLLLAVRTLALTLRA